MSSTSPSFITATFRSVSSPATSVAKTTFRPRSSCSLTATGASENSFLNSPLGRPRCEHSMTLAPFFDRYSIVGRAAVILVSSLTFPFLSKGTLKSTRTRHLLPFNAMSVMLFFIFSLLDALRYIYEMVGYSLYVADKIYVKTAAFRLAVSAFESVQVVLLKLKLEFVRL